MHDGLKSSGLPLGGLGTGSVELRADGCFHEWQIMNNRPWGSGPEIGIFHRIVLPNIGPALSALGIFTFLWVYNDFTWPLMALSSVERYTVPLGLSHYQERYAAHVEYLMAGSTLAVVPLLLVFILFQRRITEGVTLTGMGKL